MLELDDVVVEIAGARILDRISLTLAEGTTGVIIGPNGAGKSTLVNSITGLVPLTGGAVRFEGRDLTRLPTQQRIAHGIAHVLERRRLFGSMTVEENLRLGAWANRRSRDVARRLETVYELVPLARQRRLQKAGSMSGGQQQMIAIARGLMAEPRLLILDEPLLGLSPSATDDLVAIIRTLQRRGVSILFIEQNVDLAFGIADVGFVIETGRLALSGPTATLREDPELQRVYLG